MTFNMTQLQQANTIMKVVVYSNDSTGGVLMIGFMLAIFFVMLLAMKRYPFPKALLATSGISFVISVLFVYAKLLNPIWALTFLILTAGSAFLSAMFD